MPQLKRQTGISSSKRLTRAVALVQKRGEIVEFSAGNRTTYTTAAVRPTLSWLYKQAEGAVDPHYKGKRGRRRSDDDRRVEKVSEKDLERMRTALNHIGRHLAPDGAQEEAWKALDRVGRTVLVWDPTAGAGGRGDWRMALELLDRAVPGGARPASVGAIRKLLDLAATHGWITQSERHDEAYEPVPPEWAPIYDKWREGLVSPGSLLTIFEAVATTGASSPIKADWAEVIGILEARFVGEGMSSQRRSAVRRAYRGLQEMGTIDGPSWNGRQRQIDAGVCLLTGNEVRRIAEVYGSNSLIRETIDLKTWEWPRQNEFRGLIDGEFGLREVLIAMTTEMADVHLNGLPDRTTFPRTAHRGKSNRARSAWTTGTLKTNLSCVFHLAGWFERESDIDWEVSDLREIIDPDRLKEHVQWSIGGRTTRDSLRRRAKIVGRIASPILETMAVWKATAARKAKNAQKEQEAVAIADRAAQVSAYLSGAHGWHDEETERKRPSVAEALKGSDTQSDVEKQKAQSKAFEKAWAVGEEGECGFDQMVRIESALMADFSGRYGPLEGQVRALERGVIPGPDPKRWARDVKQALWWQDMLLVPLRAGTLRRINRGMRLEPREGWITADYPGRIMKRGKSAGAFDPQYCRDPESPYALTYRLYTMPGGALEITLGHAPRPDDPFWPGQHGRQYRNSAEFTKWMRKIVKCHEAALAHGVRYEDLRHSGTLRAKFFRHAVAKAFALRGENQRAAILLHHASTNMVDQVYGVITTKDVWAGKPGASRET